MKTMVLNIKRIVKVCVENYMNIMAVYGEALFRGRGCCGCA